MPCARVKILCPGCGRLSEVPKGQKYCTRACYRRNYHKGFKRGVKCGLCKKRIKWGAGEDGHPHPFNLDGTSHFTTCVFATKGRKRGSQTLQFSELKYQGSWIG